MTKPKNTKKTYTHKNRRRSILWMMANQFEKIKKKKKKMTTTTRDGREEMMREREREQLTNRPRSQSQQASVCGKRDTGRESNERERRDDRERERDERNGQNSQRGGLFTENFLSLLCSPPGRSTYTYQGVNIHRHSRHLFSLAPPL